MRLQKRTIRQKLAGIQAVNRIGMGRIGSILKMLIIRKPSFHFARKPSFHFADTAVCVIFAHSNNVYS